MDIHVEYYMLYLHIILIRFRMTDGSTSPQSAAEKNLDDLDPLSDDFINVINSKATTWKAARNFHKETPLELIKNLMGTNNVGGKKKKLIKNPDFLNDEKINEIPKEFDSRIRWPNCPSIKEIRDQGHCGSCWAVAAVEAMTDRYCIHSNGDKNFKFSAQDLLSCNGLGMDCGTGGTLEEAWFFWMYQGIISGGEYNSSEGCRPYEIAPCEHFVEGSRPKCGLPRGPTPPCIRKCRANYERSYNEDKEYGDRVYFVDSVIEIQLEIMNNGPVEAALIVFTDFLHYKSGVYVHLMGKVVGGHAVKIIGWGEDNNIPYWLIVNSWNLDWGDNGYFKIFKGANECSIESDIYAGIPKYK